MEKINLPLFNESGLKEYCGVIAKKVRNVSKSDQKIILGQPIFQLHVERNSTYDDQPSTSKKIKKEKLHPKKSNKKRNAPTTPSPSNFPKNKQHNC